MLAANYTLDDVFDKSGPVLMWSGVLIVVLMVGMVWALRVKRKMKAEDDVASVPATGFTLSDLRDMRKAGQISDAEFERAKLKIVAAAQRTAERQQLASEGPPPKDSVDAIRARRMTREQQAQQHVTPPPTPPPDSGASPT